MKSLLFQEGNTLVEPEGCGPGCQVQTTSLKKGNKLYSVRVYTKIGIEVPYMNMVQAFAHSIQQNEPYAGTPFGRDVRDILIRRNLVI